jgi:hypothetical protein
MNKDNDGNTEEGGKKCVTLIGQKGLYLLTIANPYHYSGKMSRDESEGYGNDKIAKDTINYVSVLSLKCVFFSLSPITRTWAYLVL